jgi:hypothetical protein
MKSLYGIGLWFLVAMIFTSCEKLDIGDCFKSTGKVIIEERESPVFEHIVLEDNINVILTQDNRCSIRVQAGENLIGSVITEVNDGELTIRNDNQCNWMRSYNKDINVYLSVNHLVSIYYKASGNIISTNTIVTDSLNISVWDGSGIIDMDIQTVNSVLDLHYGTVDFDIHGFTQVDYIYAASYGPFHCQDLVSVFCFMNNKGSNDCYVNCTKVLEVEIENIGNIYYKGDPETIKSKITGTGRLIKLEE